MATEAIGPFVDPSKEETINRAAGRASQSAPVQTDDSPPASDSPAIEIVDYTDPLCSWSWAFEPQWRRLRFEFGSRLAWRYRMAGMIPDWRRFNNPLNAVSTPAQMAPHWRQIRAISGMPLDERIWFEDPPASSYPACRVVKAAERQGAGAGEAYLRRAREAVMCERRNIARQEVLLELADEVEALDADRFARDFAGEEALADFRDDLKEARYHDIGRFPTLILRRVGGAAVMIVGFRPYDVLRAALGAVAPDVAPVRTAADAAEYLAYWSRVTDRELAEALNHEAAAGAMRWNAKCGQSALSPSAPVPFVEQLRYDAWTGGAAEWEDRMDRNRFDAWTRRLHSRRALGLTVVGLGLGVARSTSAAPTSAKKSKRLRFGCTKQDNVCQATREIPCPDAPVPNTLCAKDNKGKPFCAATGNCAPCTNNSDCAPLGPGALCVKKCPACQQTACFVPLTDA